MLGMEDGISEGATVDSVGMIDDATVGNVDDRMLGVALGSSVRNGLILHLFLFGNLHEKKSLIDNPVGILIPELIKSSWRLSS